ncbi:uncharacterized protein LOC135817084 [Sycon ciliatum]|uniref:uncharacterized protein LOC135817084 n=1 Tax=Sycon ciliatum TaxID=27933 RepID=UPI0031F67E99
MMECTSQQQSADSSCRALVSSSIDASTGGKIERQLFIPFLEKLLDSDDIDGLEWICKDKRIFRMPWKHMKRHDYDLERDSMLFKAWAVNSGKFKETEQDPSRWKINFRSALNTMKHVLVEEESSDEDCRVFRILESTSTQQRKRRAGDAFAMDSPYSVQASGYASPSPAKHYPMKAETDDRRVAIPAQFQGVQQYPWQPTQYVYPPGSVAMAPPAQFTYYTTATAAPAAVDGHHGATTTYYVPNQNAAPPPTSVIHTPAQPQQVMAAPAMAHHYGNQQAMTHYTAPAQYMHAPQAVAGAGVANAAGTVVLQTNSTAQNSGNLHQVAVPAPMHMNHTAHPSNAGVGHAGNSGVVGGQAMAAVNHEHAAHMLSPQSLKTNNSCESLRSAQSMMLPVTGIMTAIATSSATSLGAEDSHSISRDFEQDTTSQQQQLLQHQQQQQNQTSRVPDNHDVNDSQKCSSKHRTSRDKKQHVSMGGRTHSNASHRKSKDRFFAANSNNDLASASSTSKGKSPSKRSHLKLESPMEEESRDDEVIVDVVSSPMDEAPSDHGDMADHEKEHTSPGDTGEESPSTESDQTSSADDPQETQTAAQQDKEKEIHGIQCQVEDGKRQLEQLEGSLAERNARIVQMELQREQLNVCLHREWLIVKDLVSMVTAHKTQMEQLTVKLSQLRNPSAPNPIPNHPVTATTAAATPEASSRVSLDAPVAKKRRQPSSKRKSKSARTGN